MGRATLGHNAPLVLARARRMAILIGPMRSCLTRYSANWAARQRRAATSPSRSRISSNFTPTSVCAA